MREQAEKIIQVSSKSLGGILTSRPLVRPTATDNVLGLWRRYGGVPPTESGKNFRAALRTTAGA